jgi:hypothetical protein
MIAYPNAPAGAFCGLELAFDIPVRVGPVIGPTEMIKCNESNMLGHRFSVAPMIDVGDGRHFYL